MDYAKNNRSILQELRPKLYEKMVEKEKEQTLSLEQFEKIETRDGKLGTLYKKRWDSKPLE